MLIFPPNALINLSRSALNIPTNTVEAPPKSKLPSPNWEWFMAFVPLTIWMPCRFPVVISYSSLLRKDFAIRI